MSLGGLLRGDKPQPDGPVTRPRFSHRNTSPQLRYADQLGALIGNPGLWLAIGTLLAAIAGASPQSALPPGRLGRIAKKPGAAAVNARAARMPETGLAALMYWQPGLSPLCPVRWRIALHTTAVLGRLFAESAGKRPTQPAPGHCSDQGSARLPVSTAPCRWFSAGRLTAFYRWENQYSHAAVARALLALGGFWGRCCYVNTSACFSRPRSLSVIMAYDCPWWLIGDGA